MFTTFNTWSPVDELWALNRTIDRFFARANTSFGTPTSLAPSTDVLSSDEGWRVRIAVPGVPPEGVEVNVAEGLLHVRVSDVANDNTVTRYEQRLRVPEMVDAERITATCQHGLLEISLPLKEQGKPRRIEIATTATAATSEPKQLSPVA
jgi:HSP20 family protein